MRQSSDLNHCLTCTQAKGAAPAAPVSNGAHNGTAAAAAGPADGRESTAEQPIAAPPADPYAFLPPPSANNAVQTTVNFSDGRVMRIANTQVPTMLDSLSSAR